MFRNTTAGVARRTRLPGSARSSANSRRWASGGAKVPDIAHNVNESLGLGFWATFAAVPVLVGLYKVSRPGPDGEMHWITRKVFDYQVEMRGEWEDRNIARTQAIEQAAHDKHLFHYANEGLPPYHEVRHPDALFAGCPRNVPAGHFINLDHVIKHYQEKAQQQELRRANRMAAREAKLKAQLEAEAEKA